MSSAIDEFPSADYHFYLMGLQYYLVGRFGAVHGVSPVAANLLHHAVEMILKGRLAHHHSLKVLKNKLSHHLDKCWTEFKILFPTENLTHFDNVVDKLNEFEELRYPDEILRGGAFISCAFVTAARVPAPGPSVVEPAYVLSVTDIDELMRKLFTLCGINPEGYLGAYSDTIEFLERNNVSCQGWFPQREKDRASKSSG